MKPRFARLIEHYRDRPMIPPWLGYILAYGLTGWIIADSLTRAFAQ